MENNKMLSGASADAERMESFVNREVSPIKAVLEGAAFVAIAVLWIALCCAA